jgi:hypothetical protein
MEEYQKYKWFYTASGKLVVGGKNATQNDELIRTLKQKGKEHIVMHTSMPGSPFTCIVAAPEELSKQDRLECAIFTGAFSKAWKAGNSTVIVDIFRLSQLTKRTGMKTGTWGVNGYVEKSSVPLKLVLTRQKGVLRAVPELTVKKKKDAFFIITPGAIEKADLLPKLEVESGHAFHKEEVLAALPAGGVKLTKA